MSSIGRTGEFCSGQRRVSLVGLALAGAIGVTGVLGTAGAAQAQLLPLPVPLLSVTVPSLPVPLPSVPGLLSIATAPPVPLPVPAPAPLPIPIPVVTSVPSLPIPILPLPSLQIPSLPIPSLPIPSLPIPSLPIPSLPIPIVLPGTVTAPGGTTPSPLLGALPAVGDSAPSQPATTPAAPASVAPIFATPSTGQAGAAPALPGSPTGVWPIRRWLPGMPDVPGTTVIAFDASSQGSTTGGRFAALPGSALRYSGLLGYSGLPLVAGMPPVEAAFVTPGGPPAPVAAPQDGPLAARGIPVPMKAQFPALLAVGAAVLLGLLGGMDVFQLRRRRA